MIQRKRMLVYVVGVLAFVLVVGCTGKKGAHVLSTGAPIYTSSTPIITHTTSHPPTATPAFAPTPTAKAVPTSEGVVTITGIVQDTMVSAQVIMLQEPVQGFSYVALTEQTKLYSAQGESITLRDVRHGMKIRVAGHPGSSDTLLAEEIHVLP